MNKITKIVLHNDMVNIHRGDSWHTYYPKHLTDASRIRLNDVLIVWSETGKVESRPYVGPGWCITTLRVVDVPKVKKNVNAGRIAEQLAPVYGKDDASCGLGKAVIENYEDREALLDAISEARSDLIVLALMLRKIEEESIGENA